MHNANECAIAVSKSLLYMCSGTFCCHIFLCLVDDIVKNLCSPSCQEDAPGGIEGYA